MKENLFPKYYSLILTGFSGHTIHRYSPGRFESEAADLYGKARSIKIPPAKEDVVAEYGGHPGMKGICSVEVVPKHRAPHAGSTRTLRLPVFDMEVPYRMAGYDKLGFDGHVRNSSYKNFLA